MFIAESAVPKKLEISGLAVLINCFLYYGLHLSLERRFVHSWGGVLKPPDSLLLTVLEAVISV